MAEHSLAKRYDKSSIRMVALDLRFKNSFINRFWSDCISDLCYCLFMNNKILFYGELPPATVHGISLSNQLNIDILNCKYDILIIKEQVDLQQHARLSLVKLINFARCLLTLTKYSLDNNFSYFYLNLSMSTFGIMKSFLMVVSFRLLNSSPVILHMHRGDFLKFYKNRFNKILSNMIFKLVAKVIVLSQRQKDEIERLFHNRINIIEVIENSLSDEFFIGKKQFTNMNFLYISNYIMEKGIIDLLETFKLISTNNPLIKLECYGSFSNNDLKKLISSYRSNNIAINNQILGMDKFKKLHECYCLILPSLNEGQPIILLEAMSQGTPVITTDVGYIRELLGDDYPYIYNPGNKQELAQMITSYIEARDKNEISNYLRIRYYQLFCKEKHAIKLLEIFS